MKFTSKYDIGEEVYYYNAQKCKVERGIITGIGLHVNEDSIAWSYLVRESGKSKLCLSNRIEEVFIFRDRDEVFKFAYQITENI